MTTTKTDEADDRALGFFLAGQAAKNPHLKDISEAMRTGMWAALEALQGRGMNASTNDITAAATLAATSIAAEMVETAHRLAGQPITAETSRESLRLCRLVMVACAEAGFDSAATVIAERVATKEKGELQ
jgi:hypothetical protein